MTTTSQMFLMTSCSVTEKKRGEEGKITESLSNGLSKVFMGKVRERCPKGRLEKRMERDVENCSQLSSNFCLQKLQANFGNSQNSLNIFLQIFASFVI